MNELLKLGISVMSIITCDQDRLSFTPRIKTVLRRAMATLILGTLGLTGCGPVILESSFLDLMSGFALAPEKTCEQLKATFGVPDLEVVDNPAEAGIDYEELYVYNASGIPLRVWVLTPAEPVGTIVFSDGAVGETACYLLIAKNLYEAGYRVVMYDYQGFGGSGGTEDLFSLYGDLDAVLEWTLAQPDINEVTLMGVSLGTMPSMAQAVVRPEVNALVLDGLISLQTEIERLQFLFAWRPEAYYSMLDETLRIQLQVPHVYQPMLVVIYGRDEYATSRHAREILADSPATVTFLEFSKLKHARGPYLAGEEYFAAVLDCLDSVWTAPAN